MVCQLRRRGPSKDCARGAVAREYAEGKGPDGVADKPSDPRGIGSVIASAGFAERCFLSAGVIAKAARAVQNRCEHSFTNLRQYVADIQIPLDPRLKILSLLPRVGILQVIKRSTVCKSSRDCGQLQGRNLNPFAKARHPRHPAERRRLRRERTRMLIRQVVSREFAKPQKPTVL